MTLVAFDPSEVEGFYEHYYQQQEGNGLAVFRGKRIMDGNGLGSILGGVFRAVAPTLKNFAKSAAKSFGNQALSVAGDILRGEDAGQSALRGLKNVGGDILSDAKTSLQSVDGEEVRQQMKRKRGNSTKKRGGKRKKTIFDGI